MFRRAYWRMGVAGLIGSAKTSTVTVLATDSSDNVILAKASSTNPSGTAGYAVGCILIGSDGKLYSNTGDATTCTFTAVSSA